MDDAGITRFPLSRCLYYKTKLDAHSVASGPARRPKPNDLTVCLKCGAVMLVGDDLTPRGMTEPEMHEVMTDPEIMTTLARVVEGIHFVKAINKAMGN
jgi:hypothetical protein